MPVTRELMLLAATALAWFAYAVIVGQAGGGASLPFEVTRILALALSAIVGVRLLGLLVFDVFVERIWGVTATSLVRLVVYALMSSVAVALLLKEGLDINLATLLTTSALLTAIIGLSVQSPLSAFFSGVALQIERQIRLGDIIRVDNRWATVENIGWRSIMARRDDGTAIIVPNTLIGGSALPLRQTGTAIASELLLPAPLAVPPALMAEIIGEAISGIAAVSPDHPIGVFLSAMRPAEGLADYGVQFFTRSVTTDERPLAGTVRMRLWYAYQRHAIELPRSSFCPDPPALAALAAWAPDHPQAPIGDIVAALGSARRWQDTGSSERERLARSGRRLLFAPREPIRPPRGLDGSLAVVVSGTIRLIGDEPPSLAEIEPPLAVNADPGAGSAWYVDELQPVEEHLGYAIGPFARLAVRRAAAQTANPAELFQRLAPLIEKAADREAFLRNAPDQAVQDFGAGAVLRLRRTRETWLLPSALDQVELLALPVTAGSGASRA
jgi:small-conductance mechanosensitive channel